MEYKRCALNHFGHHVLSSKNGPDVVSRHNTPFFEFCQRASLGAQVKTGSSLGHEARQTRPADILIPNWELGKPAAVDLCITSVLNYETLQVACGPESQRVCGHLQLPQLTERALLRMAGESGVVMSIAPDKPFFHRPGHLQDMSGCDQV